MSQNHFTISFPIKSQAEAKMLAEQLPPIMPQLFQTADTIGTIHSSRFTILNGNNLIFIGDFDGDLSQLMGELARLSGPVFNTIFKYVVDPPALPVEGNKEVFIEWIRKHLLPAAMLFSAYPDVTSKEIKAMASAAGVSGAGKQLPFLLILPIKSQFAYLLVKLLLHLRSKQTQKDLGTVGTPHFAQFVPLGNLQVGFFTMYDGTFDDYIADFTKYIGPVFDLVFKFTKNPPPSPCRKHVQEFIDFGKNINLVPIGFYLAYPGLTVQDIHALIADSKL